MASSTYNMSKPKVILCDIEGTTTSISFVKDVLFPYARNHLRTYLETTWDQKQTETDLEQLWEQYLVDRGNNTNPIPKLDHFTDKSLNKQQSIESIVKYVNWQMDRDLKNGALKQLQGHIWKSGYDSGEIQAHIYPEVPRKFQEWYNDGIVLAIYSSGSVDAQKLLFSHTKYGDLTKYIGHYFDTRVGDKRQEDSYRNISSKLGLSAAEILFLTDIGQEALAAKKAGMPALLVTRDDVIGSRRPHLDNMDHIDNFDELVFTSASL